MQDRVQDLEGAIVGRLTAAWMVDAEWSSPIDGGFRWWAHRLEQRITVEERPVVGEDTGTAEVVMRAETTVLTSVPDQDGEYGLALEEIAGTLAQDAIAITGTERGDMLALATRMKLQGDLVPRALAACPQTRGPERRSM